jgi:PiT family inorganic phosphate transporter
LSHTFNISITSSIEILLAGPFIFGTAVAATVGKDIIQPEFSTISVIFAGLIGAIAWNLITWYLGLPSSSSHALVGGLIGSGLAAGGLKALVSIGIQKTLIFMVLSPVLGLLVAYVFTIAISCYKSIALCQGKCFHQRV